MGANARWGIYLPAGDVERDPAPRMTQMTPSATDAKPDREVLLVDGRGRPILVREPRRVGFRSQEGTI